MYGLSIGDARCDAPPVLVSGDPATMAVDARVSYRCTHTVTQDEVDASRVVNVASVEARRANGSLTQASASATTPVAARTGIRLVKFVAGTFPAPVNRAGDRVDYGFRVHNAGTQSLRDVVVNEASGKCDAPVQLTEGDLNLDGVLQPSEVWVFRCSHKITQEEVDLGRVSNTATVSANGPDVAGERVTSEPSSADLPIVRDARLSITSEHGQTVLRDAGDIVNYTFTIRNTGSVSLSGVSVDDKKCTPVYREGDVNGNAVLEPTERWVFACSYALVQAEVDAGEVTNAAAGVGTPVDGQPGVSSPLVETPPRAIPADVGVAVDVSVAGTEPEHVTRAGETVHWQFTARNSSNVTLRDIGVAPAGCDTELTFVRGDVNGDGLLQRDEAWVYLRDRVTTQADVDSGAATANATATGTRTDNVVTRNWDYGLLRIDSERLVEIDKRITWIETEVYAGDVVTYGFDVSNPGTITLKDIAVTDLGCDADPVIDDSAGVDGDFNRDG